MRKKKQKAKKGISPLFAALLLLGSMGVVGRSILGGGIQAVVGHVSGVLADANPDELPATDEQAVEAGTRWIDLLAEHGSYVRGGEVRQAFVAFEYPSSWTGPTSGAPGEAPAGRWVGEDPPLLRLGVVMVSRDARRAVLGGKVIGVGDAIATGTVTSIEAGTVTLEWSGRKLTYDLEDAAPREFRHERGMRKNEAKNSDAAEPTAVGADADGKDGESGSDTKAGTDTKAGSDTKEREQ